MTAAGPGGERGSRSLGELLSVWQAWNSGDVTDRAARRAEAAGDAEQAEKLRGLTTGSPSALDALAAQHELTSLLEGWHWHTVLAAREQGATWRDIAAATSTDHHGDPDQARTEFLERIERARDTEARFAIPFRDAARYDAAVAPDDPSHEQEPTAMHSEATTADTSTDTSANSGGDSSTNPSGDVLTGPPVPSQGDPALELEDTWFRASLEQTVPAGTPDRDAVIDAALDLARSRFLTDATITYPDEALDLLRGRPEDTPAAMAPTAWISPEPTAHLTAAELLVRAERADNRTYFASNHRELDAAYRDMEAVGGEAYRRAQASGSEADRALSGYVEMLIEDPGVERLEEYTALHHKAHQLLGVPAVPPDDEDTPAAAQPSPARSSGADTDSAAWEQGDDAATWTAVGDSRDTDDPDGAAEGRPHGLVVGTIVLPGGLPPDDDEHGEGEHAGDGRGEGEHAGDGRGALGLDAAIESADDRRPWSEPSTGRQWDSLGLWARESATESIAREAASPPRGAQVDDGPEIARRLAAVRAQVAARDAALADDVPTPRCHTYDDVAAADTTTTPGQGATSADAGTTGMDADGMDEGWGR